MCPHRKNQRTLISLAFKRNRPCCFHPHLFPINLHRGNLSRALKPEPKCSVGKKGREKKKINISIFAKGHGLIDLPMSNTSQSKDVCCVLLKLCVARWVGKTHESFLWKYGLERGDSLTAFCTFDYASRILKPANISNITCKNAVCSAVMRRNFTLATMSNKLKLYYLVGCGF